MNFATQRISGSGRWKDLADVVLAPTEIRRSKGRLTIERLTICVFKDRDDRIEPLEIDVVNRANGGISLVAAGQNKVYLEPQPQGRPSKDAEAEDWLLEQLVDRQPHRWSKFVDLAASQFSENPLRAARTRLDDRGLIEVSGGEGRPQAVRRRG